MKNEKRKLTHQNKSYSSPKLTSYGDISVITKGKKCSSGSIDGGNCGSAANPVAKYS